MIEASGATLLPPSELGEWPPAPAVWITGLPSAGKSTLGRTLVAVLRQRQIDAEQLDGDVLRRTVSEDLGFDRSSREHHAARAVFLAKRLAAHRIVPVVTLITPYRRSRRAARAALPRFLEVFLDTPLAVCEQRDGKGLYRRARAGLVTHLTGLDDPYERPEQPDIVVRTPEERPVDAAERIVRALDDRGWLETPQAGPVLPLPATAGA